MNYNSYMTRVICLCLTIILLGLTGCMTSSSRSRGSLSDAMDKARDDHEGSREVPDDPDPWWERDDDDDYYPDNDDPYTGSTASDPYDGPLELVLRYGDSLGGSPYFSRQRGLEIALGFEGEGLVDLLVYGGIHSLETDKNHPVYLSIGQSALLLNAGIEGRVYPFREMTFFSPYAGARIGGIYMTWSFENPLTAGGDTIFSDTVGGLSLGVCAGVDLLHTDHLRLGLQLNPEAYFFSGETGEGFENDYFGAQGFLRVTMEGGIIF